MSSKNLSKSAYQKGIAVSSMKLWLGVNKGQSLRWVIPSPLMNLHGLDAVTSCISCLWWFAFQNPNSQVLLLFHIWKSFDRLLRKPRAFEKFSFSLWKINSEKWKKKFFDYFFFNFFLFYFPPKKKLFLEKKISKKIFFSRFTIYFSKWKRKIFERSGLP